MDSYFVHGTDNPNMEWRSSKRNQLELVWEQLHQLENSNVNQNIIGNIVLCSTGQLGRFENWIQLSTNYLNKTQNVPSSKLVYYVNVDTLQATWDVPCASLNTKEIRDLNSDLKFKFDKEYPMIVENEYEVVGVRRYSELSLLAGPIMWTEQVKNWPTLRKNITQRYTSVREYYSTPRVQYEQAAVPIKNPIDWTFEPGTIKHTAKNTKSTEKDSQNAALNRKSDATHVQNKASKKNSSLNMQENLVNVENWLSSSFDSCIDKITMYQDVIRSMKMATEQMGHYSKIVHHPLLDDELVAYPTTKDRDVYVQQLIAQLIEMETYHSEKVKDKYYLSYGWQLFGVYQSMRLNEHPSTIVNAFRRALYWNEQNAMAHTYMALLFHDQGYMDAGCSMWNDARNLPLHHKHDVRPLQYTKAQKESIHQAYFHKTCATSTLNSSFPHASLFFTFVLLVVLGITFFKYFLQPWYFNQTTQSQRNGARKNKPRHRK